jgi:hypothetical protein
LQAHRFVRFFFVFFGFFPKNTEGPLFKNLSSEKYFFPYWIFFFKKNEEVGDRALIYTMVKVVFGFQCVAYGFIRTRRDGFIRRNI